MRILDYLSVRAVKAPLASRNKEEVVEELIDLLIQEGQIADKKVFLEAVRKREQTVSTAIGEGVAIPHAKVEGIASPCIAVGLCPEGMFCDAPDSKPVTIIFLLASSPRDAGMQLKILAALSRYIKAPGLLAGLAASQTPQEVFNVFQRFEEVVRL